MPSIGLTHEEEERAVKMLGIRSIDDLFSSVPPRIRDNADFDFDLSHGLSEHELRLFFKELAERNQKCATHFLGGGIYDNIVPAIVNQLALRGEFLTCYTPYQPEISQGTLTAIFEFQTLFSRLTSMPVVNASMYDGATATAEAITMAQRLRPEKKVVLMTSALPPDYLAVTKTFLKGHTTAPHLIGYGDDGLVDQAQLQNLIKNFDPCAIVVGYPNYFGLIEDIAAIRQLSNALLIVAVSDPSALSIFEAPGVLGADIVCGEAQQFGTPMSFGGPHCGFFATKKEFLRQMPGRIAGETVDSRGNRAYTLTLSTREQHIRREKATSNICTNQGLIALRTTIYLSFLGKEGLVELGEINYSLFDYLRTTLLKSGIRERFHGGVNYREGVFEIADLPHKFQKAVSQGVIPGIRFTEMPESWKNCLLITVNPKHKQVDIDRLAEYLS